MAYKEIRRKELLNVRGLTVKFEKASGPIAAVNSLSYTLYEREILAIIGESGSGKTVSVMSVLGLLKGKNIKLTGSIAYDSRELLGISSEKLRAIRGNEIAIIFQNPSTALNPSFTIKSQLRDVYLAHHKGSSRESIERAIEEVMEMVSLPTSLLMRYPHMLSGGQKQRVAICMSIINRPKILIFDEATTALDATIQMQILNLVLRLRDEIGFSIIFVTHDIGVVARIADRVLVMYRGSAVEYGDVEQLFYRASMPYTQLLIDSIPKWNHHYSENEKLKSIAGQISEQDPADKRCIFIERCPKRFSRCEEMPEMREVESGHLARCHLNEKITRR